MGGCSSCCSKDMEEVEEPIDLRSDEDFLSYASIAVRDRFSELPPLHQFDSEDTKNLVISKNEDQMYYGECNPDNYQRKGFGTQVFRNGSLYEGHWQNNLANGHGRIICPNGEFYEGNFANDKISGKGKYHYNDGSVLDGNFVNGKIEGNGTEIFPDGSKFAGQFQAGEKVRGLMSWRDKSNYKGEFKDNSFHGKGVYTWKDGSKYEGHWMENMMHGKGKYTFPDGKIYEGDYEYGLKNGAGEFHWPNGKIFKGDFQDGKQHGVGTYIDDTLGENRSARFIKGRREQWLD